jgi:hypothetical protein
MDDIKAALDQGQQLVQAPQQQQGGEGEEEGGGGDQQGLAPHDARGHVQLLQLLQAQPDLLVPLQAQPGLVEPLTA